jgi:hypothetical protein
VAAKKSRRKSRRADQSAPATDGQFLSTNSARPLSKQIKEPVRPGFTGDDSESIRDVVRTDKGKGVINKGKGQSDKGRAE